MTAIGDAKGTAKGIWYCRRDWKNMYFNGDLTEKQLLAKVIGTIPASVFQW